MEQLLIKLARQLEAIDEASLMSLWEKYALTVSKFEPTQRWQEAALILSMIQAKRWKNQLFNTKWALSTRQTVEAGLPEPSSFALEVDTPSTPPKRAKILQFRPHENTPDPE